MKVDLLYNPAAGRGQGADGLLSLLTDAGHEVRVRSSEGEWRDLLQDPGDLLVAAGGDGTVRKVALAAADHGIAFAVLPIGTANNVAKSLGLFGDARHLVAAWSEGSATRAFDVGEARLPQGSTRFVESIGAGPVAGLIACREEIEADARLLGRETDRAIHVLARIVREAPLHPWRVVVDGADHSGEYLAVEVLNTRFIGPNVPVAPGADLSDGLLDVVLLAEDDRASMLAYLDSRLRLASGQPPSSRVVRGRQIELLAPAGAAMHLDDRLWPTDDPLDSDLSLEVRCLAGAANLLEGAVGQ